jgi:uncharacterized protein (DUF983 family)
MPGTLVAQLGAAHAIGGWVIIAIVVAAIIGIGLVIARHVGLQIPAWFVTILWIVVAAIVGIVAIKLLLSLL